MTEPYRDEANAIEEKLRQIEEELAHIDRSSARRPVLQKEAAQLAKRLEKARAEGPLEKLQIASPCNARWEDMVGDDRVRHCAGCKKDVFNVSGMTRAEAVELVTKGEGELCLRMFKRADGTVMTADCPVGVRRKRVRRLVMVGAGVAASVAGGLLYAWVEPASSIAQALHSARPADTVPHTMGSAAAPTMGTATAYVPPPAPPSASAAPSAKHAR